MSETSPIVVIGGGPAGSSAAYWLASRGHRVTIVERRSFPRSKPCGDALTPRAAFRLSELGLAHLLDTAHHHRGVRLTAGTRSRDIAWPAHRQFPQTGVALRRRDLDEQLAQHAVAAGADRDACAPFVPPTVLLTRAAGYCTCILRYHFARPKLRAALADRASPREFFVICFCCNSILP